MRPVERNNVQIAGNGTRIMMFGHGFGCDQAAWKDVAPAFEPDFRTITFDHVGAGGSDLSAYDIVRHGSLHGYAADLVEILAELDLREVIFVGHSVSGMIGMLAATVVPDRFASLIMVAPSPCYVNQPGYIGGFTRDDLEELLEVIDSNFLGWSRDAAPAIMGNPERPELAEQLTSSFSRTNPEIARQFARVTFLSDHRADLPHCPVPTLILQPRADMIAPVEVGEFIAQHMERADLVIMNASGHCPHMSAPAETIADIKHYLGV